MPFRPKRSNTQSEEDLAAIERLNLNGPGSSPLASPMAKKKENKKEVLERGSDLVRGLEEKVNGA